MAEAVAGYDIPAFPSMSDFKIWAEVEPPKGTIYNYPLRPWHDAEYYITGSSGPPEIAVQMWNRSVIPAMVPTGLRQDHQGGDGLGQGRTGRLHSLASFSSPGLARLDQCDLGVAPMRCSCWPSLGVTSFRRGSQHPLSDLRHTVASPLTPQGWSDGPEAIDDPPLTDRIAE